MEPVPFISMFIDFFKENHANSKEKKKQYLDAVFVIEKAINRTQNFISKNQGNYSDSTELADLWTEASRAIFPFDPQLSEMLVQKADFWSYPDRWINLGGDQTIVTLNNLRQETQMLRIKLQ